MRKIFLWTVVLGLGVMMMFGSLLGPSLEDHAGTQPLMDIRGYFDGPIKAWGMVQDWRGRVMRRFSIDMEGRWEGDAGTLTERFYYDDGQTQDRVWTIRRLPDGSYEGTAPDIDGKAVGRTVGCAARWYYVMHLPVDGTTYRIHFDDWMWAMQDGVLINRSYLKKFGLPVGELTIFMQKQPAR
jgi:hypothetical protein